MNRIANTAGEDEASGRANAAHMPDRVGAARLERQVVTHLDIKAEVQAGHGGGKRVGDGRECSVVINPARRIRNVNLTVRRPRYRPYFEARRARNSQISGIDRGISGNDVDSIFEIS